MVLLVIDGRLLERIFINEKSVFLSAFLPEDYVDVLEEKIQTWVEMNHFETCFLLSSPNQTLAPFFHR